MVYLNKDMKSLMNHFYKKKIEIKSHPNYMNLLEYVNNSNLVVNITTFQQPQFVKVMDFS